MRAPLPPAGMDGPPPPLATATTTPVPLETPLPLSPLDFDAATAALYRSAIRGAARADLLRNLCIKLGALLRVPLLTLSRRDETGAITNEAASAENGLWLELQRIPERWDGGLSSHGPAGAALEAGVPVLMDTGAEGFALWRAAAAQEHIRQILAIPVECARGLIVFELFSREPLVPAPAAGVVTLRKLIQSLAALLTDFETVTRRDLIARALGSAGNAAFITDLEGTIVWSNPAFSALSGYATEDLRGRNPNILKSGHQGVRYYRDLWGTIRAGRVWSGETIERARDGHLYTVRQTVSPVTSEDGRITHYLSVHQDISREKHDQQRLELHAAVDPGTGLLSRTAFEVSARETLARVARDGHAAVLVLLALRGLPRALGDSTELGDALAATLGQRLRAALPAPHPAGAFARGEFAVLLTGAALPEAEVDATLGKIADALREPLPQLGGIVIDVHCGTGRSPADGTTFEDLVRRADRQLADEPYARARRHRP